MSVRWLTTGEGDPFDSPESEKRFQEVAARLRSGAYHAQKALEADLVMVRHLGIEAGAGPGRFVVADAEYGALAYRRDLLREMGVNPEVAGLATVRGHSMNNLLHDGDTVLIDRSDVNIRSGRCYVFRLGDELLVKYLQRLPGGLVEAISENADVFKPFTITPDQDMELIGRVRSHNHRWD